MKRKVKIEVVNLKKYYTLGKTIVKALNGVSFKVYEGEFIGIMGPSGSGKSTLLYQIGLLDFPTEGKVIIDGVDTSRMDEKTRCEFRLKKLGFVFQQYRLMPELTALENVILPLIMQGVEYEKAVKRGMEILERVGLKKRAHHYPSELSGGEQQRVSIARAIVNDPSILLADEPTANLDTVSGTRIMELFKELNEKHGQTIVMVSHEPEHEKYFSRIIYIKDGVIVNEG